MEENNKIEYDNKLVITIIILSTVLLIFSGLFIYYSQTHDIIKKSDFRKGEINLILKNLKYCNKGWNNPCWISTKEELNDKSFDENDVYIAIIGDIKLVFHTPKNNETINIPINELT